MFRLCSKTCFCYDRKSRKYKINSKGPNKGTLEDGDNGRISKYQNVLEESVNVTLTMRRFRTVRHTVALYEQIKKSLSPFHAIRAEEEDGIHEYIQKH